MALTVGDCERMLEARDRNGVELMIAHCIRFWPEYEYLLECINDRRFGQLKSLYMERVGYYPEPANSWFNNCKRSGSALIDLHVHDVDWALMVFGEPDSIHAVGLIGESGGVDDVTTVWTYRDGPIVTIRGSWMCHSGFNMGFQANFDDATVNFGLGTGIRVTGVKTEIDEVPSLSGESGHASEMKYFIDCVSGRNTNIKCPAESSKSSIEMAICEREMITSARTEDVTRCK